jgi:hypothetical protein
MIINNLTLAYLCRDLQNAHDYRIDGNSCYYKEEFIGEIKEELKDDVLDVYFRPITPVKYINVNITIDKP